MTSSPWRRDPDAPQLPSDEEIRAEALALVRQIGALCEGRSGTIIGAALTHVLIALFADIPMHKRRTALDAILAELHRHILLPEPPRAAWWRRWGRR